MALAIQPPELDLNERNNTRTVTRKNRSASPVLSTLDKKILVFDTETTGFIIPRIVQIAYCKYYETGINHSQHSHYVRQATDADLTRIIKQINPELVDPDAIAAEIRKARFSEKSAQEVHKIPDEIINDPALPSIQVVLQYFMRALFDVSLIVGHNVEYDLRIVYNEARRINYRPLMAALRRIPFLDTMRMSKEYVKAVTVKGARKGARLEELYKYLFPDKPNVLGLHNAIIDVDVTAQCFFELQKRKNNPDEKRKHNIYVSRREYVPTAVLPVPAKKRVVPAASATPA